MGRTRPGALNFRAWIFRIVTNLCLRELNRRGRVRPEPEPTQKESAPARPDVAEQLSAALERLPGRYREILLLRELSELSYAELAEALELSEGNVKVLLHRARARFAAVFIASRLVAEPATAVSCATLADLLGSGADRRRLEQHLEGCSTCRQLEKRPAAAILSLLPAPPVVSFPELPPRGAVPDGTAAAGGATSSSTSVLVVALVAGAAVLAVAAIIGVVVVRDLRDQPVVEAETAASTRAAAAAVDRDRPSRASAGASAPGATKTATESVSRNWRRSGRKERSDAAEVPLAMPKGQWRDRKHKRHAKSLGRRKAPAARATLPQAIDPEAPPH
jgi:DNA-binding CsgD family transcriptional regulator